MNSRGRGSDRAALVTLCLSHLPFHPSSFLGYGTAVLARKYDLDVLDLNAELHFRNRAKLKQALEAMDKTPVVSDTEFLDPFYDELEPQIDRYYEAIPWSNYPVVYVTPPAWFPTVPTAAVLRLSGAVKRVSPDTRVLFFGNSLGSWTNEEELQENGVQTVHLNGLCEMHSAAQPVRYDSLPTPIYGNIGKYLFDLLPFMLKHGCSWARCRFCSLCRGWNSGYLERSPKAAVKELEALIDRYDPSMLVCRDNALNGHNLLELCSNLEKSGKPWCGMSRADLSGKEIEALARAGCKMIYFGLESGSDRMLQAVNKGITSRQMSDFIKMMYSNGIVPAPSLMIGAPGEGRADFEKTIQFLEDHREYFGVVNVYPFMATPGSEFDSGAAQPVPDALLSLFQFIQRCGDLGLTVCVGEQCAEYVLFKSVCSGSGGRDSGYDRAS